MFIGIDARLYGPKHAGIGRYTMELVKKMEQVDLDNQYVIFLQRDNFEDYQPANNNFKKVLADFRAYSWQEQILFPLLLMKYKFDFVHFTHFNVPILYWGRFIVTIHDLIISHYPSSRATMLNPILYRIKLWFYQLIIKTASMRADRIIAVTDYTKKDIIKYLKADENKIKTVYEGVDLPAINDSDCEQFLSEKKISGDFLLYVGSAYPHKNLEKLIEAFKIILKNIPDCRLVLVGKLNYFYHQMRDYIKNQDSAELSDAIILTGYVDDDKLSCLYHKAKLYVFPSLIEGFGLPPLEAQAYGLPVASSDSTCLPEVLADSVVYFNPKNAADMADKIQLVINDQEKLRDLAEKGAQNVKRFSWLKMAEQINGIYKSLP